MQPICRMSWLATLSVGLFNTAVDGSRGLTVEMSKPAMTSGATYDKAGRLVRVLWTMKQGEALATIPSSWNSLDPYAQPVPPGTYTWTVVILNLESEGEFDRLPDTVPFTVFGGAYIYLSGDGENATSEGIGGITLRDGLLQIRASGKTPDKPTIFTGAGLDRDPASVLVVVGGRHTTGSACAYTATSDGNHWHLTVVGAVVLPSNQETQWIDP